MSNYMVINYVKIKTHHNVTHIYCVIKQTSGQPPVKLPKIKPDNVYFYDTCKNMFRSIPVYNNNENFLWIFVLPG